MLDEGGARTQAAFVLGQGDRLAVGAAAFVAANGLGASEQQQLEAEAFRQMSLHGRVPHVPVAALVAATPADVVPLLLTAIAAPPTTALPSEEKFPPRFQRWRCPSARRRRTARGIATVCRRRPSAEAEAGGGSPLLVLVHCLDFAPPSAHEAVGILRGLANYTGDGAAITSGAWAKPPAVGDDDAGCARWLHITFVRTSIPSPPPPFTPHIAATPAVTLREVVDASFDHACRWWRWRHGEDPRSGHRSPCSIARSCATREGLQDRPATIVALLLSEESWWPLNALAATLRRAPTSAANDTVVDGLSLLNCGGSSGGAASPRAVTSKDPLASHVFAHYVRSVLAHTGQRVGEAALLLAAGRELLLLDDASWCGAVRSSADVPVLSGFSRWKARQQALGLLYSDVGMARRLGWWSRDKQEDGEAATPPEQATASQDDSRPLVAVASHVHFLVLVVTQGDDDVTTRGCFEDMASTVASGLRALGFANTSVAYCAPTTPGSCGVAIGPVASSGRQQVIVLAPHNLANIQTGDGVPLLILPPADPRLEGAGWGGSPLIPRSAVLYNFEHVPSSPSDVESTGRGTAQGAGEGAKNRKGTFVNENVLAIYRQFVVWDFSRANVDALARLGLTNTLHVPLGYAPSLMSASGVVEGGALANTRSRAQEGAIDVLFYGTATPRRLQILDELRSPGAQSGGDDGPPLRVMYANAANFGVFGEDLDALIMDAKIVLSLLTFDDDDEWKISRLSRLLANARFVVAENVAGERANGSFAFEEQQYFAPGVVFAPRDELRRTCQHFLARPEERRRVAAEGHRLFKRRSETAILEAPVRRLLQ
jgi:hypothetical protein